MSWLYDWLPRRGGGFDPDRATEEGLVAIGGPLTPSRVLQAYRAGVFPWYNEGQPVLWWSPDPRAIIPLDGLHVSRRLARTLRQGKFTFTLDAAFDEVMAACAHRPEGTWVTRDMRRVYGELHRQGHAHSVEAWHEGDLAGGVYGLALGGFFAGESMFHTAPDASKAALAFLFQHLRKRGYTLFDSQVSTPHTRSLGAIDIPRAEYLERLRAALSLGVTFTDR